MRSLLVILLLSLPLVSYGTLVIPSQGIISGGSGINANMTVEAPTHTGINHQDLTRKSLISLVVNHHVSQIQTEATTTVKLKIERWISPLMQLADTNIILQVAYYPTTQNSFVDKQTVELNGLYKYKATLLEINGSASGNLPQYLSVQGDLMIDRMFDFGPYAGTGINLPPFNTSSNLIDTDCDGNYDILRVFWSNFVQAEEYQVEWTYVNDYDENGGYKAPSTLSFDFKSNSSRLTTTQNYVDISLIYDHGYLLYRVRAVGRSAQDISRFLFGSWSCSDVGTVNQTTHKYYIDTPWEVRKNWQYQATFAEEAKKKEVVSFFDGSLRNRQMVTLTSTNRKAIVGETIYDHQGRPAVQVLPTPVSDPECESYNSSSLKFYPKFNRRDDGSGTAFDRTNFDLDDTTGCATTPGKMSTESGASNYYSSANTELSDYQSYVPNAGSYPYSQVEYTADNTGRIRRQGGVGETFQLGSNHETKYYYGQPSQLELDRLFGTEVGDKSHYQKNMVMDPNGQVSVSYLDQEDRVVATALAGQKPEALKALESYTNASVTLTENMLTPVSNSLSEDGKSRVFTSSFLVSSQANMTFNYTQVIDAYVNSCTPDLCYECIYDLSIDVLDDCAQSVMPEGKIQTITGRFTQTANSIAFTTDCMNPGLENDMDLVFTLTSLPVGSYSIKKTLRVNEQALDYYEQKFLDSVNNTCYNTLSDYIDAYTAAIDFSGCYPDTTCQACLDALGDLSTFLANGMGTEDDYNHLKEECEAPCKPRSLCDDYAEVLKMDMSPHGQYGEVLASNGTISASTYPLSVYNANNQLPRSNQNISNSTFDWRTPVFETTSGVINDYVSSNLVTPAKVVVFPQTYDANGVPLTYSPAVASGVQPVFNATNNVYEISPKHLANLTDFVNLFQPSWAYSLIYYHPEYSYYTSCLLNQQDMVNETLSSEGFDHIMEATQTWDEAVQQGFIPASWLSNTVPNRITDYSDSGNPLFDPFIANTSLYGSFGTAFFAKVNAYKTIGGNTYSMMEIAAYMNRCGAAVGQTPSLSCTNFGADAANGNTYGTTPADSAARNADWITFKGLYRSLKQGYWFKFANNRAINDPNNPGYNDCIGNPNFDPSDNGFWNGLASEFTNNDQPCSIFTFPLYVNKEKRFMIQLVPEAQLMNTAGANYYNMTGNCPEVATFSNLLSELATQDNLDATGVSLQNSNAFAAWMINQTTPPSGNSFPAHTWNMTSVTTTNLAAEIIHASGTLCTLTFQQTGTSNIVWDSIDGIHQLNTNGLLGTGTHFSGFFMDNTPSGTVLYPFMGTVSLNMEDCAFSDVCHNTSVGSQWKNLVLNMFQIGEAFNTYTIATSNTTDEWDIFFTNQLGLTLSGTSTPDNTAYWSYANNSIAISGSGTPEVYFGISNTQPSGYNPSNIAYYGFGENIDENTFELIGYTATGDVEVTFTIDATIFDGASINDLVLSECISPVLSGCDNPTGVDIEPFTNMIKDVLLNQTAPYNLYASTLMTNALSVQLNSQVLSTSSAINWTLASGDTIKQTIPFTLNAGVGSNIFSVINNTSNLGIDRFENLISIGNPVPHFINSQNLPNGLYYLCDFAKNGDTITDTIFVFYRTQTFKTCESIINFPLDTLPVVEFVNPCFEELTNAAIANAYNAYQNHVDSLLGIFRDDYIRHCMNLTERLDRTYSQAEHHFTLYYYDQAGNLIKTVPPEGVEQLPITADTDPMAVQIAQNRASNTQTVFTTHRMATVYKYNSLNQLVAQHMPDMDDVSKWNQTLANGLDVNLVTTGIHMADANLGYLSGYVSHANAGLNSKRGYLYKTTDGGSTWSRVDNLYTSDLKAVRMATGSVGFAVGNNGLALRTMDGGSTWDVLNMNAIAVTGNFRDVAVKDANNAVFVLSTGHVVEYKQGALYAQTVSYPITPDQAWVIQELGGSSTPNTYLLGVNVIQNGETNSRIYRITVTGSSTSITPTEEKIIGDTWQDISMYDGNNGVAVGSDADAAYSNVSNVYTNFRSSNQTGTIESTVFLNQNAGIAIIRNTSNNPYLFFTTDGGRTWSALHTSTKCYSISGTVIGSDLHYVAVFENGAGATIRYNTLNATTHTTRWQLSATPAITRVAILKKTNNTLTLVSNAGGTVYTYTHFAINSTTAPSQNLSHSPGTFTGASKFTAFMYKPSGADSVLHISLINPSDSKVYDIRFRSSEPLPALRWQSADITPSGATVKDLAVAREFLYAFNGANNTICRTALSVYPPASTLSTINNNTSVNLPSGAVINGFDVAQNGTVDRAMVVGNNGLIYHSSDIAVSSPGNLSWTNLSELRLQQVNDIANVVYDASGINYNSILVGFRGQAARRNSSTAQWQIRSLGIAQTINAAATVALSSSTYAVIVGNNLSASRWNLNNDTRMNITMNNAPSGGNYIGVGVSGDGTTAQVYATGNWTTNAGYSYYQTFTNASSSIVLNRSVNNLLQDNAVVHCIAAQGGTHVAFAVCNGGRIVQLSQNTQTIINGVFGPALNNVHFANANTGTVVGENHSVFATTNNGSTWTSILPNWQVASTLTRNIQEVYTRPNASNGHFAILSGSGFFARTNALSNALDITGAYAPSDIHFPSNTPLNGFMAAGTNLHSLTLTVSATNGYDVAFGGAQNSGATINAIHALNDGGVVVVGFNHIKYRTPGTSSFIDIRNGVTGDFRDVAFVDNQNGYVVGTNGKFLKTDQMQLHPTTGAITAATWNQKNLVDTYITTTNNVDIYALALATGTKVVWGGRYVTTPTVTGYTAAVRALVDEQSLFASFFYYDRLGRIVVSQNSRQFAQNKYSYTLYDGLGRVVEAGEKTENTSGSPQFASVFGTDVGGQYMASVIDDTKLNTWVSTQGTTTRKEVTRSYYDATNTAINGNGLSAVHSLETTTQRKRIVHVTYEENFDNNDATYDHASHYDYDIHGNVKTLLQDNRKLGAISDIAQHRIKRFDYSYDLISGNVHRVDYQTGKADQWHHAYTYDADNRIVEAYTTTATPVASALSGSAAMAIEAQNSPHWDREAAYAYYDHGPLARTVLGEHEVQGIDNVYTLQGWIKGVNSNVLGSSNDPGKDGAAGPNAQVAVDAFSYSLHYFNGDYLSIGTQSANFIATQAAGSNLGQLKKDLYNGNIGAMVTTITHPTTRAILPLGNVYEYDQLNRLATARSFDNLDLNTNTWGSAGAEKYYNAFTYDANGNILSQVRKDQNNNTIDNLTYNYHKNSSGKTVRNRLYSVNETISSSAYTDDIDSMSAFIPDGNINIDNNYSYDAEGRLIKDMQESITNIVWRVDSKVKTIYKLGASTPKIISFDYDAMGHRIAKHVYNGSGTLERSTYYTLDAQGNAMVVYEREVNSSNQTITFTVEEKMIYGTTRLGVLNDSLPMLGTQNNTYSQKLWSHVVGKRTYELSNHLGNVLSVISDKVIPHNNGGNVDYFMADIRQAQDFSPFGVTLYGRDFSLAGADEFRYGFQNQEFDPETGLVNFEYRMHNPRLGRFFAIDPLIGDYPHYTPYSFSGNKVIAFVELEGCEESPAVNQVVYIKPQIIVMNQGEISAIYSGYFSINKENLDFHSKRAFNNMPYDPQYELSPNPNFGSYSMFTLPQPQYESIQDYGEGAKEIPKRRDRKDGGFHRSFTKTFTPGGKVAGYVGLALAFGELAYGQWQANSIANSNSTIKHQADMAANAISDYYYAVSMGLVDDKYKNPYDMAVITNVLMSGKMTKKDQRFIFDHGDLSEYRNKNFRKTVKFAKELKKQISERTIEIRMLNSTEITRTVKELGKLLNK